MLEDDTLVLGPFQGKVAVSLYPSGVACAALRLPAIKCSVSRMFMRLTGILPVMRRVILKIVLPLVVKNQIIGVLDIDSTVFGRFTDEDEQGLRQLAGTA
ncbi:GAF domain-containing protein [Escherichia coli]